VGTGINLEGGRGRGEKTRLGKTNRGGDQGFTRGRREFFSRVEGKGGGKGQGKKKSSSRDSPCRRER